MPDAALPEHTDHAQRMQHRKELEQKIFTASFINMVAIRCVPNKPCLLYEGRMFYTLPELQEAVRELRRQAEGDIHIELNPSDNDGRGVRLYYLFEPRVPSADNVDSEPQQLPPSYSDQLTDADCGRIAVAARSIAERHPEWVPPVDRKVLARQQAKEKAAKQKEFDLRRLRAETEKAKKAGRLLAEAQAKKAKEEVSSVTTSGTATPLVKKQQPDVPVSAPSASLLSHVLEEQKAEEEELAKMLKQTDLNGATKYVSRTPLALTTADRIPLQSGHLD